MGFFAMVQQHQKWLMGLLLVGFLLFGWMSSREAAPDDGVETAVSLNPSQPFPDLTPETSPLPNDLPIISDSSLAPEPNPITFQNSVPQHNLQTYVVQRGDTPNGIADRFGIQPETILGGNPQLSEESSLLQVDTELIILPIDGVLHTVQPGESIEDLQFLYGVSIDEIVAYEPNNLSFPFRLEPETQILVPGAVREVFQWTPPDLSSVGGTSSIGGSVRPVIVGTGTFVYPVNSRNYTQYFWYGHQAVDIALPEGSAVFASDTGTVTYAGWNNFGYGNLIVVNHGNGYETFYAHLSSINVVPGQIVFQGNVIGGTGNTGRSSGPHIHFEIRLNNNRDNPCWYIGC